MTEGANSVSALAAQPMTLAEHLTHQFYAWERVGRGWDVWSFPVELEPPFRPFYYSPPSQRITDDGQHPGLWQRFQSFVFGTVPKPAVPILDEFDEPLEPLPLPETISELVELQVLLPDDLRISHAMSEQFLHNLAYCAGPITLEIIGCDGQIRMQFVCNEGDAPHVKQQLQAHFPEAAIVTPTVPLPVRWFSDIEEPAVIVDFGLADEFCRPLRMLSGFEPDPFIGVMAALDSLMGTEFGALQIRFQPVQNPWAENLMRAVVLADGSAFFADAPDMANLTKRKISSPLYAAGIRIVSRSTSRERSWSLARGLGSALTQLTEPTSNSLIPLSNDDYPDRQHALDFVLRRSCRTGMLLNAHELLSIAHLPSETVRSTKFGRQSKRTNGAPPAVLGSDGCVLGRNTHNGIIQEVTLDPAQRTRHMHVIGASGTGKSTFLLHLICQDMKRGEGVAVLDPHGDLIDDVLARVPSSRINDVVLIDPADADFPIGFNILSAHSELEKTLLASDFVSIFRRLSTSWGDQMTTVLANAVLAFLESSEGGTLLDLRRFLVEKDFRLRFLETVADTEVRYYWHREFPLLSGKPQGPILTRLDTFLRPKLIRHMVAQRENRLDFASFMDSGKIVLVKLSQGAIGEENSHLLGSLLVGKFQQLALARQEQVAAGRRPFFLYIDEFHHFVTPTLASLLTGARKYRLGLVLAHQELRQIEKRDSEVASGVLANPYARICFRVSEADARTLSAGFAHFEPQDLLSLDVGEAVCRVERADWDFNLQTDSVPAVDDASATVRQQAVREQSRTAYATPRAEVERILSAKADVAPSPKRESAPSDSRDPEAITAPLQPERAAHEPAPQNEPTPPTPPKRKQKAATVSAEPPLMGRGGPKHRYLQQFIKRWAEGMGYRATIEKPLADGSSVDILLEKESISIACEISVTSTVDYELASVRKALSTGISRICLVSDDPKKLTALRKATEAALDEAEKDSVKVLAPEDLFEFIESLEAEAASREETVRGYKVNVNYQPIGQEDKAVRKKAISQVLRQAMTRLKRSDQ